MIRETTCEENYGRIALLLFSAMAKMAIILARISPPLLGCPKGLGLELLLLLESDHHDQLDLRAYGRRLSGDFTTPCEPCNSFSVLLQRNPSMLKR